jgi:hypothetical protein
MHMRNPPTRTTTKIMKCENCKFWRRDPQAYPVHGLDGSTAVVTLDARPTTGECRHELPQSRPDGRQWEPTRADDGCGQFKRRTKKELC